MKPAMKSATKSGHCPTSGADVRSGMGRSWALLLAAACVAVLAGCTSTLTTNVTHFQRWPAQIQNQTYRIAPAPDTIKNALEWQTYADMVHAELGPVGLTQAKDNEDARFLVSFEYADSARQVLIEHWHDPWFPHPWWGFGRYRGGWGWGWGGTFHLYPTVLPVQAHENTLTVSIQDMASNAQVFRTTARATTLQPQLHRVMPYLVRAVFEDFPGNNGQDREVKYKWE